MPNLSKSTIHKMRAVVKAVLAEPEFYNQTFFPMQSDCGTSCCAAGWAVWLDDPETYKEIVLKFGATASWVGLAEKSLGLQNTGSGLFGFASSWPSEFGAMYANATTPIGRAQAMAARWEHFIATDGAE